VDGCDQLEPGPRPKNADCEDTITCNHYCDDEFYDYLNKKELKANRLKREVRIVVTSLRHSRNRSRALSLNHIFFASRTAGGDLIFNGVIKDLHACALRNTLFAQFMYEFLCEINCHIIADVALNICIY